jgi:hypothetical protein
MKVREVIDRCGELLEVNYTKEDLLSCFNIVENELALDYLPLYATHKCNSKIVEYIEFEYNPVETIPANFEIRILSVPRTIASPSLRADMPNTFRRTA